MSPQVVGKFAGKRILGLDLGRRTGFCVAVPNDSIELHKSSGVFELYDEKGIQAYTDGERFLSLERFLHALDQVCGGLDVVAFEQVNACKGRQVQLYNGYRSVVLTWCARVGKLCIPIPVQTMKREIAGRGNASKEEVEAAVVAMGYRPYDDNESDAIGILHTAVSLCADRVEMERQLSIAARMHMGEDFESKLVVVKKPKRAKICPPCTKKRQNDLTTGASVVTVYKERNSKRTSAPPCSSDSVASAPPERRTQPISSSPTTASPAPSSRKRSKAQPATPSS